MPSGLVCDDLRRSSDRGERAREFEIDRETLENFSACIGVTESALVASALCANRIIALALSALPALGIPTETVTGVAIVQFCRQSEV